MTLTDALRSISGYPIPQRTIMAVAQSRDFMLCDMGDEATQEVLASTSYRLATADLLVWLACAPNISQGGQSYNFSEEQRADFKRKAMMIYDELEPDEAASVGVKYGYKGSKL